MEHVLVPGYGAVVAVGVCEAGSEGAKGVTSIESAKNRWREACGLGGGGHYGKIGMRVVVCDADGRQERCE